MKVTDEPLLFTVVVILALRFVVVVVVVVFKVDALKLS
jgi:hypothetical protein